MLSCLVCLSLRPAGVRVMSTRTLIAGEVRRLDHARYGIEGKRLEVPVLPACEDSGSHSAMRGQARSVHV